MAAELLLCVQAIAAAAKGDQNMKSQKEQKGRTLTDLDLKAVQGGTNSTPPPTDQNPDARAQVIETGVS
ncbi:MAG TPA: hypothetical protein VGH73_10170 [Thermoanaerobaculia bacterium]